VAKQTDPKKAARQRAAHARAAREPPPTELRPIADAPSAGERLLGKAEVCRVAGVTFPTIWAWMRAGRFPRARSVGGKSMWLSTEIDAWLSSLPTRRLKGDEG
jgi:predicted DNA-binding transcriptional regulator AlpA